MRLLYELSVTVSSINIVKSTGHVMYNQYYVKQLYVLPTLY